MFKTHLWGIFANKVWFYRERTKLVYSMYSRMSGEAVKRNLMKLRVDFFVLEDSWCTRRTR